MNLFAFHASVADATDGPDWGHCAAVAREHGRSFYLASQALRTDDRHAIHSIYAFCRIADDIVDTSPEADRAYAALADWAEQIAAPVDPVAVAFAHTRERYGIPEEPVRKLIEGVGRDLDFGPFATWDDLRDYSHAVAGTVGLMVTPVLGSTDPDVLDHAANLGIAMQLTNILRDVAEDAERGRLYLPLDELAAFGCAPQRILDGNPDGDFCGLIAFQIERARALYTDAWRGIPALSRLGQLATLAAGSFYAGILREIETRQYDVFAGRAQVSTVRKVRMMPRIATSLVRMTRTAPLF